MLSSPSSKKRFLRTSLKKHMLWKTLRNLLKPIKYIKENDEHSIPSNTKEAKSMSNNPSKKFLFIEGTSSIERPCKLY
jgi:hypothetical protein